MGRSRWLCACARALLIATYKDIVCICDESILQIVVVVVAAVALIVVVVVASFC